jgi:hypothetical protein
MNTYTVEARCGHWHVVDAHAVSASVHIFRSDALGAARVRNTYAQTPVPAWCAAAAAEAKMRRGVQS